VCGNLVCGNLEGSIQHGNSAWQFSMAIQHGNSGGAIQEGQFKWQFRECQFSVAIQDEAQ
jgi:hypothetical protein